AYSVDCYFHRASLFLPFAGLHQCDAVSAPFIAIVPYFVDTPGDHVSAESGIARAIERRRWRYGRVKGISQVMQLDHHPAWESFGLKMNPLIFAAMIGVLHDV